MKPAPLSEVVASFKHYQPTKLLISSQKFPDFITGERGRRPLSAAPSFMERKRNEAANMQSTPNADLTSISSSKKDISSVKEGAFEGLTSQTWGGVTPDDNNDIAFSSSPFVTFLHKNRRWHSVHYSESFSSLFGQYIMRPRNTAYSVRALLEHPESPLPSDFLFRVALYTYPSFQCVRDCLLVAMENIPPGGVNSSFFRGESRNHDDVASESLTYGRDANRGNTTNSISILSSSNSGAVDLHDSNISSFGAGARHLTPSSHRTQFVDGTSCVSKIYEFYYKKCEYLQLADTRNEMLDLFVRALLKASNQTLALEAFERLPDAFVSYSTWEALVISSCRRGGSSKMRSANVLWRLLKPDSFHVNARSGQYGLTTELATLLLSRTRVGLLGFTPPLIARQVMRRYIAHSEATGLTLHPTPFLIYFKIIRDTKAPGTNTPVLNWRIVWFNFQLLNRNCPNWFKDFPDDAEQLCKFVLDVLLRGCDPWMTLNVARAMTRRRVIDGVELSLYILHRLNLTHHVEETKVVAGKLFDWLFSTMGIHLVKKYQYRVIPTAKVLIRLKMHTHLTKLHQAVMENVFMFSEDFRNEFVRALEDILCYACHTMLEVADPYVIRRCKVCMSQVEKRDNGWEQSDWDRGEMTHEVFIQDPTTSQSKDLVVENQESTINPSIPQSSVESKPPLLTTHIPPMDSAIDDKVKERRRMNKERKRKEERAKVLESVSRLQHDRPTSRQLLSKKRELGERSEWNNRESHRNSKYTGYSYDLRRTRTREYNDNNYNDAAQEFQRIILDEDVPFVPTSRKASESDDGGYLNSSTHANLEDVRSSLNDATRKLDLQRAAREHVLAQRRKDSIYVDELRGDDKHSDRKVRDSHPTFVSQNIAALPPSVGAQSTRLPGEISEESSAAFRRKVTSPLIEKQIKDYGSLDGQWTCIWCQESNVTSPSVPAVECAACGAETGPCASWRPFRYAKDGDVMKEIRSRISHAVHDPMEASVASYYLMVYKKAFVLRACEADFDAVERLVILLASSHEKVLSGFVYAQIIPRRMRKLQCPALQRLALLFGTSSSQDFTSLTDEELRSDKEFYPRVLGKDTCRVCFGNHSWTTCAIVTRDFRHSKSTHTTDTNTEGAYWDLTGSSTGRMIFGLQDRIKSNMANLSRVIYNVKVASLKINPQSQVHGIPSQDEERSVMAIVLDAYKMFISFRYREEFANQHPEECNMLTILLSNYGKHYRRAAFVLCHIPLNFRSDEAYLSFTSYFGAPSEDVLPLLKKRSPAAMADESHPNFVQVTRTCCICLDGIHASFVCPKLIQWLNNSDRFLERKYKATSTSTTDTHYSSERKTAKLQQQLNGINAFVDGWTLSGPERLHAFYRFLLKELPSIEHSIHHSEYSSIAALEDSPLLYALNSTIVRLVETGRRANAWRLFSRTPMAILMQSASLGGDLSKTMVERNVFNIGGSGNFTGGSNISVSALGAVLRMNGVTDSTIVSILANPTSSLDWIRNSSVPTSTHCLVCFDSGHTFHTCPEVTGANTPEKMRATIEHLSAIRCSNVGTIAAADYIYDLYQWCRTGSESLYQDHALADLVLKKVVYQCFAIGEVVKGFRVLRRLPFEMLEPVAFENYWKAAGFNDEKIALSRGRLAEFHKKYQLTPNLANPPNKIPKSSQFGRDFVECVEQTVCRHCFTDGHSMTGCHIFINEVSFARDLAATFRVTMVSDSIPSDEAKVIIMRIAKFVLQHSRIIPFYIHGISKIVNGLATFLSMIGERSVGTRVLLAIPPAYRMQHVYIHILYAYNVSFDDVKTKMANFIVTGDNGGAVNGVDGSMASHNAKALNSDVAHIADHLVNYKIPIPDTALSNSMFGDIKSNEPSSQSDMGGIRSCIVNDELKLADEIILSYTDPQLVKLETNRRARMLASSSPFSSTTKSDGSHTDTVHRDPSLTNTFTPLVIHPVQYADIYKIRETFDPIQSTVERFVGYKIGSRHEIIASAVEIMKYGENQEPQYHQKPNINNKDNTKSSSPQSEINAKTVEPQQSKYPVSDESAKTHQKAPIPVSSDNKEKQKNNIDENSKYNVSRRSGPEPYKQSSFHNSSNINSNNKVRNSSDVDKHSNSSRDVGSSKGASYQRRNEHQYHHRGGMGYNNNNTSGSGGRTQRRDVNVNKTFNRDNSSGNAFGEYTPLSDQRHHDRRNNSSNNNSNNNSIGRMGDMRGRNGRGGSRQQ